MSWTGEYLPRQHNRSKPAIQAKKKPPSLDSLQQRYYSKEGASMSNPTNEQLTLAYQAGDRSALLPL